MWYSLLVSIGGNKQRVEEELRRRRRVGVWRPLGGWVLLDDHAVGQVLGVVLEELSRGSRAVGQLQLLQLLQLDEA